VAHWLLCENAGRQKAGFNVHGSVHRINILLLIIPTSSYSCFVLLTMGVGKARNM
jgi:hypothetical protein